MKKEMAMERINEIMTALDKEAGIDRAEADVNWRDVLNDVFAGAGDMEEIINDLAAGDPRRIIQLRRGYGLPPLV